MDTSAQTRSTSAVGGTPSAAEQLFAGPGEMRSRCRTFDWEATPLGPVAGWPHSLRGAVDICLGLAVPSFVWWGPELVQLYNDAALPIVRDKHPEALGLPARRAWAEVWEKVGGLIERAAAGEAVRGDDVPMVPDRGGPRETAWFTFSYGSVRDETGAGAGVFCVALETTDRVVAEATHREGEQRKAFLLALTDRLRALADPRQIMAAAAEMFGRHLGLSVVQYLLVGADGNTYDVAAAYGDRRLPGIPVDGGRISDHGPGWGPQFRAGEEIFSDDHASRAEDGAASRALGVRSGSAVPLLKDGRLVAIFSTGHPEPRRWSESERTLQREVAERTWAAVERARAEAALRESEALTRALATHLPGGAAFVVDGDLRYVLAEGEALADAGFTPADLLGKTIFEALDPALAASYEPMYRRALAGEPFAHEHEAHGRAYVSRGVPLRDAGGRVYAVLAVSYDVTERRRVEEAARDRGERQAFLLTLSDTLRAEVGVEAVGQRAVQMIAEQLRADRVYLATFNADDDRIVVTHETRRAELPPLQGEYRGSTFPTAMREIFERTIVYEDVRTDPRLTDLDRASFAGLGAVGFMAGSIRRGAEAMIWAAGAVSTRPRAWTHAEVALFEDAVERTWAAVERARVERALRESEARLSADLAGMRRLYALHATIATATDLRVALEEIVGAACYFTYTDRGCLQLVSDDGERLEMFAYRGYGPDSPFIQHFLHEGSKPACDAARRDRRRLVIEDVATFAGLHGTADREVALSEGIRATQSTPMIGRSGDLVGVLSTQFSQPHRPTEDELRLVDLLAWTAADFIERHRAETALRASEGRLRRMVNIEGVGVLIFDATGVLVEANDAFLRMTGYGRGAVEGRSLTWQGMTPPEYRAISEAQLETLARTGRIGPYEKQYILADGSRSWMLFAGASLGDGTVVEYCIDVSDRVNAEAALQEAQRRLEQALTTACMAYWTGDLEDGGTVASRSIADVFGLLPNDTFRSRAQVHALVHPDDRERHLALVESARARGEGWHVEFRIVRPRDGRVVWLEERAKVQRDAADGTPRWTGLVWDITDRKRAEAAAEQTRVEAERDALRRRLVQAEEEERSHFARELHDEAGQHLTALGLGLKALADVTSPGSEIDRHTKRLRGIANTLGRELHALAVRLRPKTLDDFGLEAALTAYVLDWSRQSGIAVDIHAHLSSERLPIDVESALYRIVQEALTNVAKHSGAAQASVLVERRDRHVVAVVEDNGNGFDASDIDEHSSPRADRPLGLLGIRERATLLGGTVEIESKAGAGTTLFVRLPTRSPADAISDEAQREGRQPPQEA